MKKNAYLSLLAAAVLLTGCQAATPLPAPSVQAAGKQLVVRLRPSVRTLQTLITRHIEDDLTKIVVELDVEVDGQWAEVAGLSQDVLPQSHTLTYSHLGNARYRVRATGYAGETPITTEGSGVIDLSGSNDVEQNAAFTLDVPLGFLPVAFAGRLALPDMYNAPDGARVDVSVLDASGDEVASASYVPGASPRYVKNLAPGATYTVRLTAKRTDTADVVKTYTYTTDATAHALDDLRSAGSIGKKTTFAVGKSPVDVAVGGDGAAWVVNGGSDTVTRISATGAIATYPVGESPTCVAVTDDGTAWVTNTGSDSVTRITATGTIDTFAVGEDPRGVAVGDDGTAWIANQTTDNVTRISPAGTIDTFPAGDSPMQVAIGGDGAVWVTNSRSGNVTHIPPTGSIETFAVGESPFDLAAADDGTVWVPDFYTDQVFRITPTGTIDTFPVGSAAQGVAVANDGTAWVANQNDNTVTRISPAGVVENIDVGGGPLALAVADDGTVWVANQNDDDVARISTTGSIEHFATRSPHAVALADDGTAWFADLTASTVTRIQP